MFLWAPLLALVGGTDPSAASETSVGLGVRAEASAELDVHGATEPAEDSAPAAEGLDAPSSTIVRAEPIENEASDEDRGSGMRGIRVSASALVGSGVSVAPGPERSHATRSPVLLTMDAGFSHPEHTWLEFSPAMLIELERGVMFGLGFRLRAFVPLRYVRPYGVVGIRAFLAPAKLYGTRVAAGVAVQFHRRLALAAEAGPAVFFWGNDLTSGGSVTKIDGSVGLRVSF